MICNRIGMYIDFDNCYATLLDRIGNLYYKDWEEKLYNDIKKQLEHNIRKLIQDIEKSLHNGDEQENNIVYAKAFSDFNRLPYNSEINIIDVLHKSGIKTFYPYVQRNKDMSDRALIISVIEDIFFKQKESAGIDTLILLTGDIDYLPLFDFFMEYSKINFYLLTFKNRFSSAYNDIFYMKNRILFIDDLFKIDTTKIEDDKKFKIFSEEIIMQANRGKQWLDEKKFRTTINDINNKCYFRLEDERAKKFIKRLVQDGKIQKDELHLSFMKNWVRCYFKVRLFLLTGWEFIIHCLD